VNCGWNWDEIGIVDEHEAALPSSQSPYCRRWSRNTRYAALRMLPQTLGGANNGLASDVACALAVESGDVSHLDYMVAMIISHA
jgi:hypothetical protein